LFLDLEFRAVFRFNYQTASSFLANAARAGLARYAQGKRHRPYSLSRPGAALLSFCPLNARGTARRPAQPSF
jgi:hypothetical protein